jgi:hypothetical protein
MYVGVLDRQAESVAIPNGLDRQFVDSRENTQLWMKISSLQRCDYSQESFQAILFPSDVLQESQTYISLFSRPRWAVQREGRSVHQLKLSVCHMKLPRSFRERRKAEKRWCVAQRENTFIYSARVFMYVCLG